MITGFVLQQFIARGCEVDLLQEFDPRQNLYQAIALDSTHHDSWDGSNEEATGLKISAALYNGYPEKSERLSARLIECYHATTNLQSLLKNNSPDITSYHAFGKVLRDTPLVMIEDGFLNTDLQLSGEHPHISACRITAGKPCFDDNKPLSWQKPGAEFL